MAKMKSPAAAAVTPPQVTEFLAASAAEHDRRTKYNEWLAEAAQQANALQAAMAAVARFHTDEQASNEQVAADLADAVFAAAAVIAELGLAYLFAHRVSDAANFQAAKRIYRDALAGERQAVVAALLVTQIASTTNPAANLRSAFDRLADDSVAALRKANVIAAEKEFPEFAQDESPRESKPQPSPKNPQRRKPALKNAARDAWVAKQREKKPPTPWDEIYDEGVRLAAKKGWDMPGSAKALSEAFYRRIKHLENKAS
jgi:hypothetical protein